MFTYFAADTQLFILAPLLIYPLWKHCRAGIKLLSVLIIISVIVPFYVTYTQNLDPTFIVWPRSVHKNQLNFVEKHSTNDASIYSVKLPICLPTIISSTRMERLTCAHQVTCLGFLQDLSHFTSTKTSKLLWKLFLMSF